MYTICSMGVDTIGEALSLGWRVVARCVRGREDGPSSRSSRGCTYRRELDMETLRLHARPGIPAGAPRKPIAMRTVRQQAHGRDG